MSDSAVEAIRYALKVARERGYREVELEFGDTEFEAKLEATPPPVASATQPVGAAAAPEPEVSPYKDITASLVGYYRPASPALEVGQQISKGDIVAVISALGLATDVESQISGEIAEVLVEENQPVEYGQVLARVMVNA